MTQASEIRSFVIREWLEPAHRRGDKRLMIRAGDVHRAMGLTNAYPAVCSVLGSNKFAAEAGVTPIERTGPANGANAYFTFDLQPAETRPYSVAKRVEQPARTWMGRDQRTDRELDWKNALVLISCVKSKLPRRAPAGDLYDSPRFVMSRELAEAQGAEFMILSSLYGLVEPTQEIDPYDYTLNNLGVEERRQWAAAVLKDLLPVAKKWGRVVFLAGARYREFLIEPLRRNGVAVEVPMDGLRQGEQLAWLASRR